jgi:transposase-like protein
MDEEKKEVKYDWSDAMEKCPKCRSKVIQIGGCGHGHCLACGFTWDYRSETPVDDEMFDEGKKDRGRKHV